MAKKRGNREGTIYRSTDGRWRAAITVGNDGGKSKRKYFTGKTRTEVAQKLAAAQNSLDRGLPLLPEKQTLGEFLAHWLETRVKTTVRPRTYSSYESHVRVYLTPCLGHLRLTQLTPQHVQTFMNDRIDDGLSPATVQRIRATLRKALADAQRWDLVSRNAASLASPPPVRRPKIQPLSAKEAKALLAHIQGHRLEPVITLALGTGMRMGEVLGLTWPDVDLANATLTIRHALQRLDGRLQLVPPKSEQSQRTLPLPATVLNSLLGHKASQDGLKLLLGKEWDDRDFVFTTALGTPLDGSNVVRAFQALLNEAGLPRQRFHDLRHACASFLLAQGVSMYTVKEILGHSQISLTIDTYAHLAPELKRDAADQLEKVLAWQ